MKTYKSIILGIFLSAFIGSFMFYKRLAFEQRSFQIPTGSSQYLLGTFEESKVRVTAKALTIDETRKYLPSDLMSRGYQPILLIVENRGAFAYSLEEEGISLLCSNSRDVVRKIGRSSLARSIFYRVTGFFFWPFSIPGAIDTLRTFKKESVLKREFYAKTVKPDGEVIPPYSSLSRILYVSKGDVQGAFFVTLRNLQSDKKEEISVPLLYS